MKPSLLSTAFVLPMLPVLYVARFLIQTFRLLGKLLGVTVFCGYMTYFFASKLVRSQKMTELDSEQQNMFKELIRLAPEAEPLSKALSKYLEPYLYLMGLEGADKGGSSTSKSLYRSGSQDGSYPMVFAKAGEDEPYIPRDLQHYHNVDWGANVGSGAHETYPDSSDYTEDLIAVPDKGRPADSDQSTSLGTLVAMDTWEQPQDLKRSPTRPFKSDSEPIKRRSPEDDKSGLSGVSSSIGRSASEDRGSLTRRRPFGRTTSRTTKKLSSGNDKSLLNHSFHSSRGPASVSTTSDSTPPPSVVEGSAPYFPQVAEGSAPYFPQVAGSNIEEEYSKLETYFSQLESLPPENVSVS